MAFKPLGSSDGGDESSADEIVAEINITPLTDIFLVLLIIFMVTSSAMSQLGVSVNLPQSSPNSADSQPEGAIVTLLPRGEVRVNQKPIGAGDWAGFEAALKTDLSRSKSKTVILEGDRQSLLGSAIEVMDHARRAGAERFAIATTPQAGGSNQE